LRRQHRPKIIDSQLAPDSIASASILADGQLMAADISSKLQTLKSKLDLASKRLEDPSAPVMDDRYFP
jgi:hypothetical protein